jgi:hypothetical protein
MIIARTQTPTISALTPEERVEAVKVRSGIDAGLREYLKQNPSGVALRGPGVPLGGPLGQIGATSGLRLGSPVLVDRNLEFLPIFNPNSAVDLISAVSAAAKPPSFGQMKDVADKAIKFTEQLPGAPHGVDITVHVIGFVRPVVRAVSALKKPGPKNKVEVSRAVVQSLAALTKLIADLPGLEHAKPYADGLSLVLKVGEEICVVSHTEVIRGSEQGLRP